MKLRHSRVYAKDCEESETRESMLDHLYRDIELIGQLSEGQRTRLLEIAEQVPGAQDVTSEIQISTRLVESGSR